MARSKMRFASCSKESTLAGLRRQFGSEPSPAKTPLTFDGARREPRHFGRLFDREAGEEAQFYDLVRARALLRKAIKSRQVLIDDVRLELIRDDFDSLASATDAVPTR